MSQGKCNLLKPVDNLTGTFFTFSQYAQDLTKQYTQCDNYRCVPSKYIALNMDLTHLTGTDEQKGVKLGEIFENYFENACSFLRYKYEDEFTPEDTLTLLFQTLEKYQLVNVTDSLVYDGSTVIGGISKQVQHIGDINIYSYEDLSDGIGYNEIYCYIPNEAKCIDYMTEAANPKDTEVYTDTTICGHTGASYNNLSWLVAGYTDTASTSNVYCSGKYGTNLPSFSLVPKCLLDDTYTSDTPRTKTGTTDPLDVFDINAVVVLYDIVQKSTDETEDVVLHKNIPLGIYFAGKVETVSSVAAFTNNIHKFVSNEEIYCQGTSYGLRVCSRFLCQPNSTEIIESTSTAGTNISAIAPIMEQMGETLNDIQDVLKTKEDMYDLINTHLAQFKNNKTNVPYVRTLGSKKYWFVNGKNTGAIAEYTITNIQDVIDAVLAVVTQNYYNKTTMDSMLATYLTKSEFATEKANLATTTQLNTAITALRDEIKVWLQGE